MSKVSLCGIRHHIKNEAGKIVSSPMISSPVINFKSLFEAAPGLYLVLDARLHIVAVSDAYLAATMTGRSVITGHYLFEIFPDNPADKDATGVSNLRASLNHVIKFLEPHTMTVQQYDIRRPDGSFEIRYWSPLNSPVLNEQNELQYIIHKVTDVTGTQHAASRLRRSEKDYELLVNSVKDYAIFMIDLDGCVASWNSGAEKIKGYTAGEIIGKPIAVFYTDEAIKNEEPVKNLKRAKQNGSYETEGWRMRKDGTRFRASIVFTALRDEENKLYGYSKITRDISLRKEWEEQLKYANDSLEQKVNERTEEITRSEIKYHHLFDNNPLPVWVLDASSLQFLAVNEMAIIHYGYSREEFLGMTAMDIRPEEDKQLFASSDHSDDKVNKI